MTREDWAACALLALPASIRDSRGEEIAGTLLDCAGEHRHLWFVRELAGLVAMGLRLRCAGRRSRRLVADGFCRGAILVMTLDLSTLLAQRLGGLQDPLLAWTSIAVLGIALAIALVGAERPAGLVALVWTVARLPQLVSHNPTFRGIAPTIVPVVCFIVLILAPRRRGLDPRRLCWLATTALLVLAAGHGHPIPPITALVGIAAVVLTLAAVLTIPADPRWAIACALPATYVSLMVVGKHAPVAWLLALGPPALLSIAAISTRRLTQPPAAL
jgi:hypothetical protein